jgi:hypothetical protein
MRPDENVPLGSPLFTGQTFRHIHEDSASQECLNLAADFFRDCYSKHARCKETDVPLLPSRILQIPEDPHTLGLRLIECREARGIYAALIHCWGTAPTLRTTTSTLHQHQHQGIAWSSLPKTFQDAATVCRAVDIPYLWIDSLCILQDSRSDWERESACMRNIYEGAT